MSEWYCHVGGENYGPYPVEHMRDMLKMGQITYSTLVFSHEYADLGWIRARHSDFKDKKVKVKAKAKREATINMAQQNGYDLVRVSSHATLCEDCMPWEQAILSLSGSHEKYPSMSDAREFGLFHDDCTHGLKVFFDGYWYDVSLPQ